ncbi:MAG TPA: hypothetical protein VMB50_02520 [Myxococcales bacterium]|nr:hypothetical protein [Myxococcales bacterium]
MGWIDHETDLLVRHIGEDNAREAVRLSRLPSLSGIAQQAFDLLAQLTPGLGSMYGAPTMAREAIEALRRRFEAPVAQRDQERA